MVLEDGFLSQVNSAHHKHLRYNVWPFHKVNVIAPVTEAS